MKTLTFFILLGFLTSCTLSFQTICTHGTATDLGDDAFSDSPDVSPTISVPAVGI